MTAEQFDTIIVGSGISGMTAGIMLAKQGQKVLVIEQHTIPGGLTQTFRRQGLIFPTGVHRLGALNPGEPLWHYFNFLGLMDRLELVPMNPDGFETYYFPDCSVKIPQGHAAYKAKLKSMFPEAVTAIDRYFEEMATLTRHIELYDPGCDPGKDLSSQYLGSLDDYFATIGIKGRLKSILCANSVLFGLPSSQCPSLTHFLITDAYLKSCFRVNESGTLFSDALCDSFKGFSGEIKTNEKMTRILVKDRSVQGIELEGGKQLKAEQVIFSGHPALLPGYCPPKTFRPFYENRLTSAENTLGIFGICLSWQTPHCPVADNDAYIYNSWDVNSLYDQDQESVQETPEVIFLSALPGQSSEKKQPDGKGEEAVLAVTALIPLAGKTLEWLIQGYEGKDRATYKNNKMILAEQIMTRLEQVFPGTRKHTRIVDTYSPATFERYTLTPDGTAYGIKKTAQTLLATTFNPATRVKGLFLTGQSIGFCGIHGGISTSASLCRGLFPQGELMGKIRRQSMETLNSEQKNIENKNVEKK